MTDPIFHLHRGTAPLLISVPHNGTHVPAGIAARLTEDARRVPDTDWHVADLYAPMRERLGASMIASTHSRYVVDLNRSEDDVSLYPGQNTTGLCPVVQFTGEPVYLDGQAPSEDEIRTRVDAYWRPYHAALREELERLLAEHGRVVLWEAHSIRSVLPFLFDGRLPDLNLGTAGGASCSPGLQRRLEDALDAQATYSHVVNGRFKGGYITRHYGDPARGIEAVQLELAQLNYMDEDSFAWAPERAARLQQTIARLLDAALA
ncbi:N-formylglutamate deformylase [Luteimonas aquatica]|uniref:N-formylglutamate deformylase n=1 Tax=Luteimonas aquatica TaxID=450364 RepID=UPI001F577052|nr:N-formylglutamate deformylase [Luteimonas aquatica]